MITFENVHEQVLHNIQRIHDVELEHSLVAVGEEEEPQGAVGGWLLEVGAEQWVDGHGGSLLGW